MTTLKPSSHLESKIPKGLARYVQRDMNFSVDAKGGGYLSDGPEITLLDTLDRVSRLSIQTTLPPFCITHTERDRLASRRDHLGGVQLGSHRVFLKTAEPNPASSDAARLAHLLMSLPRHASMFCPRDPKSSRLFYAPHVRLLLELLVDHPIRDCFGRHMGSLDHASGKLVAECFNDFVEELRRAIRAEKGLRSDGHGWSLSSRENLSAVIAYLDALFVKSASLTVLRLRLFHSLERVNVIASPLERQHSDLETLRACRKIFFDRLRRKTALFTDKPGLVWCIQPSLEGGYELDVTLLLDTKKLRKVLEDVGPQTKNLAIECTDLADTIGEYWVTVATKGRGGYIRADRVPSLADFAWTGGEIRDDDDVGRQRLAQGLGFLAARRALVRLVDEPDGPYFGFLNRRM